MRNHGVEHTHGSHTGFLGFWFSAAGALVRRPHLWWTAVRQVLRLRPSDWWSRPPYLPLPSRAYVRFRLETAYGSARNASRVRRDPVSRMVP